MLFIWSSGDEGFYIRLRNVTIVDGYKNLHHLSSHKQQDAKTQD
jgi:hypothetical protein